MADRSSAALFGKFFELLAEDPTDANKAMASRLWQMSNGYDFHPCQLELATERDEGGVAYRGYKS